MKYENFFETTAEAIRRLQGTIIMDYETKEPCVVYNVTDHKKDKVFRIYTYPLGGKVPPPAYGDDDPRLGDWIDEQMKSFPDLSRKYMNSSRWQNFKPFPLGMANVSLKKDGDNIPLCLYLERQPLRQGEQGLTRAMIQEHVVTLGAQPFNPYGGRAPNYIDPYGTDMVNCIKGEYPTAEEVLRNLQDPEVVNNEVAFHREFAIIRGPCETFFLAYKTLVVGRLLEHDFLGLLLSKRHKQLREKIEALNLFGTVSIK